MVHFYKESSSGTLVKWSAILDKPQLVKNIESAENKLIINYEDGTIEEIEVSTTGSGGGNQIIIEELSNPLTTEVLDYAQFKLSNATGKIDIKSVIPFDEVVDGNIVINNGKFILKAGKTYLLDGSIFIQYATADGRGTVWFKDYTNDIYLGTGSAAYATTSDTALRGNNTSAKAIVTPITDIEVGLEFYTNYGGDVVSINQNMSTIVVQEYRNNPVNQYGGFETEILFDGNISLSGEYTLSDNISKYDFLMLEKTTDMNIELVPEMTSNASPAPFVAFASNEYSSSYAAWKAFEKKNSINTDSWYTTSLNGDVFIGIDFGMPTEVTSFSLTCPTGYGSGASTSPPRAFILQGSEDNNQWADIKEIKNQINWSEKETRTYLLDSAFKYRYYRLFLTEKNHYYDQYGIGEIQFYKNVGKALNDMMLIPTSYNSFSNDKLSIEFNEDSIKVIKVDSISRIIGIRGQIPSLLVGGEF